MGFVNKCVEYLHRPCDPSLLAYLRICFGVLMMIDIPQERGMAYADVTYSEDVQSLCTFPLIHGVAPLHQDLMIILYAVLFANAFCIAIGFFYHLNTFSFTCIYWYIFILDTSTWNNHSYLYGLLSLLLAITNANHYWSIDGLIDHEICNRDVPFWNYFIIRYQVFLVYFIAGLKKTEADWLTGYSMQRLSREWVFDPFRFLLSDDDIDYWVVHIGGFVFDTSVGFLLLFDSTRIVGLLLCGSFHGLNSRIFSIGMFPYVMFGVSFMFCHPRSFKNLMNFRPLSKHCVDSGDSSRNPSCSYANNSKDSKKFNVRWTWTQMAASIFTVLYVSEQAFLPYSHFLTKGYNGWTQGLYGYSWDMMVHSFHNQHVKITYKNKETGEIGFLKPGAFLSGKRSRWTSQPAMAVQYARCIKKQLRKFDIKDAAVHIDVWKSMNRRFQQRIFDPQVDLALYPWSAFEKLPFVLPLLSDLSDWRDELRKIKHALRNITMDYDVVFVADFPGMHLENFVNKDLGNTTIEVLKGEVVIETAAKKNISLKAGKRFQITPGEFHKVYTVSSTPSCYSYIYINTTAQQIRKQMKDYEKQLMDDANDEHGRTDDGGPKEFEAGIADLYRREQMYKDLKLNATVLERFKRFAIRKIALFRRSFLLTIFFARNLVIGRPTSETQIRNEAEYLDMWSIPRKSTELPPKDPSEISSTAGQRREL